MNSNTKTGLIVRVSIISIVINVILSVVKLLAGLIGKSQALISDAVHSASDVLSTIAVIIGAKMASKAPDSEHPYGHERMESITEIFLALSLLLVGISIGVHGVKSLFSIETLVIPNRLTLIAAVISIILKEAMFWYTIHIAKQVNSDILKADAWHHRSDAISSIGSFIGILLARQGVVWADAGASIIICLFILKVSIDILKGGIDKVVDHSCGPEMDTRIQEIVENTYTNTRVDNLKTRMFGDKLYIDMEISVDGKMTLFDAHNIAEKLHDKIEANIINCKHCMIHVNPM